VKRTYSVLKFQPLVCNQININPQKISLRNNTQHRVILLPEYPEDVNKNNPILKHYKEGLLDIRNVREVDCYNGLGQVLMEYESKVCSLESLIQSGEATWESLMAELERAYLSWEQVFSTIQLLGIVSERLDMDRFTQLSRRAERALLTRYDSQPLYDFISSLEPVLQGEEGRLLERYATEYKFQGYGLNMKKKDALTGNWMKKVAEAQRTYKHKVSVATDRFRHVIRDPAVVREFPLSLLRAMSMDSSQPARGPWSVSLHPYIFRMFLQFCPDRRLRWNAFNASRSVGSQALDVYLNVSGHVKDLRKHRLDMAITTGYQTFAEKSMVTKMAGSVENVNSMIGSMLAAAKPHQESELATLQEYAESRGFEDTIREFDVPFFKRKQVRTLYGVDHEALREYFPFPTVLQGLFDLLNGQFGFEFTKVEPESMGGSVWDEDVSVYRVSEGERVCGHFYLDPYIRDDKAYQGGDRGWYVILRSGSQVGESNPLGALVLSLPAPGYGKPSLLSYSEVKEVVRCLGKVIQQIGSRGKWAETSSPLGLEWDALSLVPDFLSHWMSVPQVLSSLSGHWSSGARLPQEQISALIKADTHMAGYDLCNELFKAAYDLAFYTEDYESEQFQALAQRLEQQYLVLPREREDCFPLYFEDMMSGNHPAAYYSHLWARMLAADLFSAYLEVGMQDTQAVSKLSKRFRDTFIYGGGSKPTANLFREFRGRDPTPEALLLSLGLKESIQPRSRAANI